MSTSTQDAGPVLAARAGRRSLAGWLFMPVLLLVTLVVLYATVQSRELSSGEQERLNVGSVMGLSLIHISEPTRPY